MGSKKHLVYLGLSGFPKGFAAIQRQKYIAKALILAGWDVTIVCNRGVHTESDNIAREGLIESIKYYYLFSSLRSPNTSTRNILKFCAPFAEFILLFRLKKEKGITAGIITDRNLVWDAVKYRVFSSLLGFDIYLNLVELYQARPNLSLIIRINNFIFNKIGCYFYDGIIPISRYIVSKIQDINRSILLVPIVTDTKIFSENNVPKCNFILYCGAASYWEAIKSVLYAFSYVNNRDVKLVLVVGGTKSQMEKIHELIANLELKNRIEIKTGISDLELSQLYSSARALLLPLFNTIQDSARFPHKFGEYLASGTIVITNPVGEITNYLIHEESVLFCKDSDNYDMAHWIDWALENKVESERIGRNGQEIARNTFDYRIYSTKLSSFLNKC